MTGNSGDFGELVHRGYRFALSLTHDATRAEDLIQDAWFAVLRAQGPMSPAYLFTTIRNRFIDLYRRDRANPTETLDSHPEPESFDESQLWESDNGVVPTNGAFEVALGRLRPEERSVLYLAAVEGFTAKQIAELLEWPRGTVLSMLHRSKKKLEQMVKVESDTKS